MINYIICITIGLAMGIPIGVVLCKNWRRIKPRFDLGELVYSYPTPKKLGEALNDG